LGGRVGVKRGRIISIWAPEGDSKLEVSHTHKEFGEVTMSNGLTIGFEF
jgi:hypothetical protein